MSKAAIGREPLKLLFLLPTYTFGGAERTSLNLLKGIDKNKFSICLVTSRKIYQYFDSVDLDNFIAVEELALESWFLGPRSFFRDIKTVASLLRKEKPDIAFGMMHYPSSLLVFAKKLFRLPVKVIASPRGPSSEYLRYFEHNVFRVKYLTWIFSFFCRHSDGIVVASGGMKEECVKSYHAAPWKVAVIPNSVDFADINEKVGEDPALDIPDAYRVISTSGRQEREKNTIFLIHAFADIRKKVKVKLLIIGDGAERNALEELARSLDLEKDIIFAGHQSNPFKFIKRSDIFIHTCLFEGFANVIIEAMACGVPVIAVDCPYGPRDIITHGENGLLVPMSDTAAFVESVVRLLGDGGLREEMARKGYERARDFSIHRMVEGYERFYREVYAGA